MTNEIHWLVKGGQAPSAVRVDTGMRELKPRLVEWTWQSWNKLRARRQMIVEGWGSCGLGAVLDTAQQADAMRFCMNVPVQSLGEEPEQRTEDMDSEPEEEEESGAADEAS